MLFVSAKISQFALLPQGRVEARERVRAMVEKMDELGFGNCSTLEHVKLNAERDQTCKYCKT